MEIERDEGKPLFFDAPLKSLDFMGVGEQFFWSPGHMVEDGTERILGYGDVVQPEFALVEARIAVGK